MRVKKNWLVSVLSFSLALCITLSSLLSTGIGQGTMVAKADTSAKSRVQTFIGLAAGKSGTSLPDIGQLTQDELQFLGVYLSNFYVPFSTELGVAGQTEQFEAQRETMIKALSANMNFNETVCAELVDNIIGLSRSNCSELKFGFASTESETPSEFYDCSYWDFVNFMLGGYDSSKEVNDTVALGGDVLYREVYYKTIERDWAADDNVHYLSHPKTSIRTGMSGGTTYRDYVNFGFLDANGEFHQVCSAHQNGRRRVADLPYNYTSSQIAFFQCVLSTDSEEGYVFNFLDVHEGDKLGNSNEDILEALSQLSADGGGSLSDEDLFELSAYGNKVYVDCFGNIIRYGNNHQTVIIPGCMNPYTWVCVGENGVDSDTSPLLTLANVQTLSNLESGKLIDTSSNITNLVYNDGTKSVKLLTPDTMFNYFCINTNVDGGLCRYTRWGYKSDSTDWGLGISSGVGLVNSDLEDFESLDYKWNLYVGNSDLEMPKLQNWLGQETYSAKLLQRIYKEGERRNFTGLWLYWMYDEPYQGSFWTTSYGVETAICGTSMSASYNDDGDGTYSFPKGYAKSSVNIKMCLIDNLGAFGFDSSNSDIAYEAISFQPIISDTGSLSSNMSFISGLSTKGTNSFGSVLRGTDRGKLNVVSNVSKEMLVSLYTTYAIAGLYIDDDSKKDTIGQLGYRMNREGLPQIENTPLLLSDSYADDLVKTEITNMIYYALKPDATDYIKIAIKNKVNAILVDWHNDMVGSQGMGYTTGTTYYRTNYGYVTTPDLSEMQWTNSLLNLYNTAIPILIIFMVISMLIAFVTGTMSFQKAIMGTIIFAAFLLVPVNAINYVCQTCNSFTNRIYGDKFVYWALVQEETYGTALDTAASGDSYENYLKTLYASNSMNQGGESIVLKWQAPKKMASLMLSSSDKSLLDNLQGNLLNGSLLSNALSGEAYLDGASQYMYRDYSDLANFSRFIHHSTNSGSPIKRITANGISESGTWNTIHGVQPNDAYMSYVQSGYTNGSQSWTDVSVLTSMYSDVYNDVTKDSIIEDVRVGNISQSEYVGINQDLFNVSLAYFNNTKQKTEGGEEDLTYESAIRNNLSSNNTDIDEWLVKYSESEYNSLMVYGIMSESPYYYFSWCMYDNGMSTSANAGGGYKTMLLSDQDGGYFYNMSGNGELKDFMNMRNLFYHVIPYCKQGNDLVRAWDDRYGIFIYDGVPTDEGYLDDPTIQGDDSLKYKYWHNLNVARLYTVYTPWLDLMYDCDYAKPCYVKVMGTKYYVEDPLNPWCYPAERPMIFSESEMYDYGLTEGDLTEVERKILKFNRESQEDMYELLNYYNFSDLSLNTAAAMQCTFNFNRIFSETGFFSNNINLYPQSFEIKDFSYDAFLRFILSTTTGESLAGSTDFYGDLVKKSSTTTAILLLVCDILSQYVVPFAKVVFLIAIFVSSVLLITVTVFRVDPEFRFVGKLAKGIAVPLLEFCAVTMGFAYVVSLFMGVGNNAVTQSDNVSISLGDPNMVLIAMCVLNLVCVVLYVKLLINLWNDIKTHASLIKNHVSGLVGGAILMGVGGIKSSMSGMGSGSSGVGGYNETGTGRESARATTRASKSSEDINNASSNGVANERISDSRRTTITNSDGVSDSKRSKDIEDTINQGRDKVNRTVGTAVETSGKVVGKTTEAVGGLAGDTVRGVGSMTGAGIKGAGAVAGGVTKGVGSVAGAGVKGVGHVTSAVLTATGVGAAAIPVIEGVTNTVGNGIKSATNTAGNIQKKAGQVVGDATKSTTSAIGSGVKTVSKGAGSAIEGLGGSAGDSIRNS